jgi:oxygen-dependent protoporphyrinogen oxidase
MEAEEGSLIQAIQRRAQPSSPAIFTTLASGLQTLIDRMAARLPAGSVRLRNPIERIEQDRGGWRLTTADGPETFDAVVLATPPHVTGPLLRQLTEQGGRMADLLPQQATSAIVVALAFAPEQAGRLRIPRGFGFVIPQAPGQSEVEQYPLLACTFVDQKFPGRVPPGAVLLRAFFGGHSCEALLKEPDDLLIERARLQLGRVLGPLPQTVETVVRRWPLSLPQYSVGHLDRMAELESLLAATPTLRLVGSAYYGVGLPDLVRQGRSIARSLSTPIGEALSPTGKAMEASGHL